MAKCFASTTLVVFLLLIGSEGVWASFVIQSQETVKIELKGYAGLTDTTVFVGAINAGETQTINTPYRGLALLHFESGQQYPLILGEKSFVLNIKDPDTLPSFTGSVENDFFYKLLTEAEPGQIQYDFPLLMIQAKLLLDESYSIHSVDELSAMKEKFQTFVSNNYQDLQHSDMLMRLLGQYFMMHEYVDFYIEGNPASDIQVQYKKAVVSAVTDWIELLKPYISEYEVLNYCLSLYYNRSMVSLAHLIVNNFRDIAYCPGSTQESISLPEKLSVIDAEGNAKGVMKDFGTNAVISFVSADCPVSMVETVVKARQLAAQGKDVKLIVVPLQGISDNILAMNKMLVSGNMFFVNNQKWDQNTFKNLQLPLFINRK